MSKSVDKNTFVRDLVKAWFFLVTEGAVTRMTAPPHKVTHYHSVIHILVIIPNLNISIFSHHHDHHRHNSDDQNNDHDDQNDDHDYHYDHDKNHHNSDDQGRCGGVGGDHACAPTRLKDTAVNMRVR